MSQDGRTHMKVPVELHKKIKIQAAKEGIFNYELIDKAINEYIEKRILTKKRATTLVNKNKGKK